LFTDVMASLLRDAGDRCSDGEKRHSELSERLQLSKQGQYSTSTTASFSFCLACLLFWYYSTLGQVP